MRVQFKVLVIAGALLTAGLGASAAAAAAATAPLAMDTSVFACSNGVCEAGPGNVGMPSAAGTEHTDRHRSQSERGEVLRGTTTR